MMTDSPHSAHRRKKRFRQCAPELSLLVAVVARVLYPCVSLCQTPTAVPATAPPVTGVPATAATGTPVSATPPTLLLKSPVRPYPLNQPYWITRLNATTYRPDTP